MKNEVEAHVSAPRSTYSRLNTEMASLASEIYGAPNACDLPNGVALYLSVSRMQEGGPNSPHKNLSMKVLQCIYISMGGIWMVWYMGSIIIYRSPEVETEFWQLLHNAVIWSIVLWVKRSDSWPLRGVSVRWEREHRFTSENIFYELSCINKCL